MNFGTVNTGINTQYLCRTDIMSVSHTNNSDRVQDIATGQMPPGSCYSVLSLEALASVKEP